jgi:hypothetical protein
MRDQHKDALRDHILRKDGAHYVHCVLLLYLISIIYLTLYNLYLSIALRDQIRRKGGHVDTRVLIIFHVLISNIYLSIAIVDVNDL